MSFRKLLLISRPRFWIYLFGPYIVGLICGASTSAALLDWRVLAFGLYFLFPANLLVYGINDIYDWETDRNNPKKTDYETLVTPSEHTALRRFIGLFNLPFAVAAAFSPLSAIWMLLAFFFTSQQYSSPPLRAKTKPILDSVFNVLYILPAALGYFLAGGTNFSMAAFVAAWLWAMAMHAYSAVPDITIDREANTPTVATLFGLYGTLVFCALLYIASTLIAFRFIGRIAAPLGLIYVLIMYLSIRAGEENAVRRIYKWFPLVNTACGFVLFWAIALHKFFGLKLF